MSASPARRTLAEIILLANVMPDWTSENSPLAPGNRFWLRRMCCSSVTSGGGPSARKGTLRIVCGRELDEGCMGGRPCDKRQDQSLV